MPNPSLNADAPRAGLRPGAGRRLASFVSRHALRRPHQLPRRFRASLSSREMKRRSLLVTLGVFLVAPLASGQRPAKPRRIAVLMGSEYRTQPGSRRYVTA